MHDLVLRRSVFVGLADAATEIEALVVEAAVTDQGANLVGKQLQKRIVLNVELRHSDGKDIARPGELLLDSSGAVRWLNLTEDIRVRATPEQVLEATRLLE